MYYTFQEFADLFGISTSSVVRLVEDRQLRATRLLSSRPVILQEELDRFVFLKTHRSPYWKRPVEEFYLGYFDRWRVCDGLTRTNAERVPREHIEWKKRLEGWAG